MTSFNLNLKGLDGTEIKDENGEFITLGKLLANQIAFSGKGDALKLFNWAQKMYAGEEVELDAAGVITIKELINNNEQMTIIAKAQILSCFTN